MAKNTICVWYDKDAEAAARFYAETFPDSAVEPHPGNFVLPLSHVMGHDPTNAHVTQSLQRAQKAAAGLQRRPAISQIHRDVDGLEKSR